MHERRRGSIKAIVLLGAIAFLVCLWEFGSSIQRGYRDRRAQAHATITLDSSVRYGRGISESNILEATESFALDLKRLGGTEQDPAELISVEKRDYDIHGGHEAEYSWERGSTKLILRCRYEGNGHFIYQEHSIIEDS